MKILLAVDGSKFSLDAVDYLIKQVPQYRDKPQVELITVHLPVPRPLGMHLVIGKNDIDKYYSEEGESCLAEAKKRLDAAGVSYAAQILVGQIAETLNAHAEKTGCDLILIGTHGRGAPGRMLLGSVATAVTHLSKVPVLLVK